MTNIDQNPLYDLAVNALSRLRAQRDVLRQRGMDIPPGSLKSLETVQLELETIHHRMVEQQNEVERLRRLVNTTSVINSSLNLDHTLGAIMDTVVKLTQARRGYILLRNFETGEMEVRAARGIDLQDSRETTFAFSKTIVDTVLTTGEPVVTNDALSDSRFVQQQSVVGLNLRSVLCVPLIIKGDIQGVVYADNNVQDTVFGNKELQMMVAVAHQSALAIENARLYEQARATLEQVTEIKILLDNILASIVSGVITTDAEDRITTYNVGAEAILRRSREEVVGHLFSEVIPNIYQAIHPLWDKVRLNEESVTLDAETFLDNDPEARQLNLKLSPFQDGNQITQGIALVVDDQTELKKRDAMLQAVRRYLPPAMVDNIRDIESIGLGGKRRTVTILFVEVLPFVAFQDRLQADKLMELLNVYLTVGTEAIHRRAGLIDKYMGSEIMGLFNTQLNPSDQHAWDAVHAAIEMIYDFHDLYKHLGESPNVPYYRMGIHTGIATLGNVGGTLRREFTALGDTVNLAKRLEENASQGQLFISQETYEACAQNLQGLTDFEVLQRGHLQVKGRVQETMIYEIKPRM